MSFGSSNNIPLPKQKLLNVAEERTATNEQARPLPYFAGLRRLGVTFASQAFAVRSEKVKRKIGKKKETVGYNYYASFAALVCHGPVDRLKKIIMDGDVVWEGDLVRSGNYVDITIANRGNARLYWGTETQIVDPTLSTSGQLHSAYRGQCYIVFNQLFFGMNKTNAPNTEVELARYPQPGWMTVSSDLQGDCNLVAIVWEFWINKRFGLGLPESRLNTTQLNSLAVTLNTEQIGISPLITRTQSFRQTLQSILENFDGVPTQDEQGRFGMALMRDGDGPSIILDDLVDVPELKPQSWQETFNQTYVRFSNRDKKFDEDSVSWRDRGNFNITQELRTQTINRPFVTRQDVALKIAAAQGRRSGLPLVSGSLRVRKSRAVGIDAGGLFRLQYLPLGLNNVLCRCLEKTFIAPDKPEVSLQFEEDRSYLNAEFYISAPDEVSDDLVYETIPLAYQSILEVPYGLNAHHELYLLALPVRADPLSNGFKVWVQNTSGSYRELLAGQTFAQRAHVLMEYPADTLLIDEGVRLQIQFDSLDNTLDEFDLDDALHEELLLFMGGEILSAFNAELVATGRYTLSTVRARYDTVRKTHAINTEVFVIRKADLTSWESSRRNLVQTYKLQPFLLEQDLDLSEATPINVNIVRRAYRPLRPHNLRVFNDGVNPTYGTGQDIDCQLDFPSEKRAAPDTSVTENLDANLSRIVVEVRAMDGMLKSTLYFDDDNTFTITNAQIVSALGSQTDFKLRAFTERNGYRSLGFDELTVWKV
jgi:hypothetical protein